MRAVLLALLLIAGEARAMLSEQALAGAVARPPAGARLPSTLDFEDLAGRHPSLGAVAAGRPLVLLFADYSCRHVCGPGLALTAAALAASGLVPGRDYRLAVIGLDPKDGPEEARAMTARLGSGAIRAATAVLRGAPETIAAAERALGYRAVYDPASDQYAHDAAVYVFAPDGRLTALLPELGLNAESLRAAVAGTAVPPSLGERVARLCYGFGADHGRYGAAVANGLRAAAIAFLIGGMVLLRRGRRRRT